MPRALPGHGAPAGGGRDGGSGCPSGGPGARRGAAVRDSRARRCLSASGTAACRAGHGAQALCCLDVSAAALGEHGELQWQV